MLIGRRATDTKQDELLKICIRRVNIDAFWARYPSTIYGSYIRFRKNLPSWKKLGIDLKIELPLIRQLPMKEDVFGYGVAI